MDKQNINFLEFLLDEIPSLYQACKQDRSVLHKLEWESDNAASILGEAEIRCDSIVGHASKLLSRDFKKAGDFDHLLNDLSQLSLYQSQTLLNWMISESWSYPSFTTYLQTSELLLWTTVSIITD